MSRKMRLPAAVSSAIRREPAGEDELHADLVEASRPRRSCDDASRRIVDARHVERDDQPVAGVAGRESALPHQSFLSATSAMAWSAPLRRIRSARGRVGTMFSRRLTRLMRSQRPVAIVVRLGVGQIGIFAEIGAWVAEARLAAGA